METIESLIIKICKNQLLGADVRPAATFEDHGFDSLDLVNIIMETEQELAIDIHEDDIKMTTTIEQYIKYVSKLVEAKQEVPTAEVN